VSHRSVHSSGSSSTLVRPRQRREDSGRPIGCPAGLGTPVVGQAGFFLGVTDLPNGLGLHGEPPWRPLPLAVVGATIRYLPGRGGHSPADGFKPGGVAQARELPGIFLAALASLSLEATAWQASRAARVRGQRDAFMTRSEPLSSVPGGTLHHHEPGVWWMRALEAAARIDCGRSGARRYGFAEAGQ
jgi:hypothetical protein